MIQKLIREKLELPNFLTMDTNNSKRSCLKSKMLVCSYVKDDNGLSVLNPVLETTRVHSSEGSMFEIANLLVGGMSDELIQLSMSDQMQTAEEITTQCVRRFGTLNKQREELAKKYAKKEDELLTL